MTGLKLFYSLTDNHRRLISTGISGKTVLQYIKTTKQKYCTLRTNFFGVFIP